MLILCLRLFAKYLTNYIHVSCQLHFAGSLPSDKGMENIIPKRVRVDVAARNFDPMIRNGDFQNA